MGGTCPTHGLPEITDRKACALASFHTMEVPPLLGKRTRLCHQSKFTAAIPPLHAACMGIIDWLSVRQSQARTSSRCPGPVLSPLQGHGIVWKVASNLRPVLAAS